MHFLILLFLVFSNVLHGSILCHLFFSNLHMNNLSDDIVSTIKQLCRSCVVIFDELLLKLYSNFENKTEWTICHFMNSDLNKQAQALKVTFSRKTKSYHSQTCFNKTLRIYLNEKLNFYHHIKERNAQMHIRSKNLFY